MSNLPVAIEAEGHAFVDVKIVYNMFELQDATLDKLDWRPEATLSDYLEGLPEEVNWLVALNGEEICPKEKADITLQPNDRITLVVLPEGGNTFKSILKIVAVAAAMVIGYAIGGVPGMIIGGAIASISMVVAAALMRPKPKTQPTAENTYGIDGAKNSATENIPVPVIYGEFRFAGNFADLYTENIGDTQYLYLRSIINDGPIEGIYDIELNEQPIANFANVETRIDLGYLNQEPNPWFKSSIRQINKAQKITTSFLTHTTTDEIEQARFDLLFPRGLVDIDQKKGKYRSKSVTFQLEYKLLGASGWGLLDVPLEEKKTIPGNETLVTVPAGDADAIKIEALISVSDAMALAETNTPLIIESRPAGSGSWTTAATFSPDQLVKNQLTPVETPQSFSSDQYIAFDTGLIGVTSYTGNGEFRIVGGGFIDTVTTVSSGGQFTISDNRATALRRSILSAELPRGIYELRIRRVNAESTSEYIIDEVHLSDIAEIEHEEIGLVGKATLSLKIKLTDQLSSVPTVTGRVKASLVRQYDSAGVVTGTSWSNNPAWIYADIKHGPERGAGIAVSRGDWPKVVELAKYCEDNNITFNGAFTSDTNMYDAITEVLRVCHSAPITIGTKYSITTDKPRDPVQAFNSSNIIRGSMGVTYIPFADRANEFEVRYYDKLDRNKEKTIRYVDPKAVLFNETAKAFTADLRGVDTSARANEELWRLIYSNRLLVRTVKFQAYIDSISCTLGDVILLQTDRMDWSEGGLLKSGSTTTAIKVDRPLTLEPGENYSIIVQHDAVKLTQKTIDSVVSHRVFVPKLAADQKPSRMIVAGKDFEIIEITRGTTLDTILVANNDLTGLAPGAMAEFWQTDKLEERTVSTVTPTAGDTATVNITTPLSIAPGTHARFIFGKTSEVVRPFTVIGIDGEGVDKRTLSCIEYKEEIYGPPEVDTDVPIAPARDRTVAQVTDLMVDYDSFVKRNQTTVNVRVHWSSSHIWNYGGADVYARINGSTWRPVGSTQGGSEYAFLASLDDDIAFRVVAFSRRMDRAPFEQAPVTTVNLDTIGYTEDGLIPTYQDGSAIDTLQPAEPDSTRGAPAGTPVAGVLAEVVVTNTSTALSQSSTALTQSQSAMDDAAAALEGAEGALASAASAGSSAIAANEAAAATATALAASEAAKIEAQGAAAAAAADEALAEAHKNAAQISATSASGSANTAIGQAVIASDAASAAATSQSIAAGHASTASTQAGVSTTQAAAATAAASSATTASNLSATYRDQAADYAINASQNANVAQTQANISTTQAGVATAAGATATTQANLAASHATTAANGATTATTQAGIATTQATTATNAASSATTASNLSATYRDQSQGFRNEAEGFKNTATSQASIATSQAATATAAASTATTQASLSASFSQQSKQLIQYNRSFDYGLDGWAQFSDGSGTPAGFVSSAWEGGNYWIIGGGTSGQIFSKQLYPVDTSRKYRFKTIVGAWNGGSSGAQSSMYVGFAGYDAAGNLVSHGGFGSYRYCILQGQTVTDGQVIPYEATVTGEGNGSWLTFPPGTKQIRLMALNNYNGSAANGYIGYIEFEDVTESVAAASSASIATSQAATATAAASSATTASNLSATYRDQAQGHAGTALAQANIATTQAAAATAAASSATTQSTLSANHAAAAAKSSAATYPDNFLDPTQWTSWGNWGGSFSVSDGLGKTFNGGSFYSAYSMPISAGKRYRFTITHRRVNQGGGTTYVGPILVPSGAMPFWVIQEVPPPALNVWQSLTGEFTADAVLAVHPTTTAVRISALLGYNGVSDAEVSLCRIEDITSEAASATSASIATTQAAAASASAASAASSAVLSASLVTGHINRNSGFDDYPVAGVGNLPANWTYDSGTATAYGSVQRVTDPQGGYAMRLVGAAAQQSYCAIDMRQPAKTIESNGWYVWELDWILNSGTNAGVGSHLVVHNSAQIGINSYNLSAQNDGVTGVGLGTAGETYSIRKLFQVTSAAGAHGFSLYAMSHWSGLGDISAANDITWLKCGIRRATPAEIRDQTVLAPLQATVASEQTARIDLTTKMAEARLRTKVAASGGNPAILEMFSATGASSFLRLGADQIHFGDNTIFYDASDVLESIIGSTVNSIAWGAPFGADSNLLQWFGPTGVALASRTKANAYFYISTTAPRIGGSALPVSGGVVADYAWGTVVKVVLANGASAVFESQVRYTGTTGNGTMTLKLQWSLAGANSWTDFGTASEGYGFPEDVAATLGASGFSNSTGLTKTYDVRATVSGQSGTLDNSASFIRRTT